MKIYQVCLIMVISLQNLEGSDHSSFAIVASNKIEKPLILESVDKIIKSESIVILDPYQQRKLHNNSCDEIVQLLISRAHEYYPKLCTEQNVFVLHFLHGIKLRWKLSRSSLMQLRMMVNSKLKQS